MQATMWSGIADSCVVQFDDPVSSYLIILTRILRNSELGHGFAMVTVFMLLTRLNWLHLCFLPEWRGRPAVFPVAVTVKPPVAACCDHGPVSKPPFPNRA
jgi:hypothetical protein